MDKRFMSRLTKKVCIAFISILMLSSSFSAFADTTIHPLQPINLEVTAPQASVPNNQPDIFVRING